VTDYGTDAIVITLHIHAEHAIEVLLCSGFDITDMRNAGVIYQNMDGLALRYFVQKRSDLGLIGHVAPIRSRLSSQAGNLGCDRDSILFVDVENADCGAVCGELECDGSTYAAAAAGNDGGPAIEPEFAGLACRIGQSETPRFQGMKSSWFFSSALVCNSPLATRIT
jgi:hypothetical protein